MAATLTCDIVTPERRLYTTEANLVAVPATDGEIGVLRGHVPLVSTLGAGEVRVTLSDSSVEHFAIAGGYVQIRPDSKVIVLANRAVNVADIDIEAAKAAVEDAEAKLAEIEAGSGEGRAFMAGELAWAKLQVNLASRK